jgi:hypothetical protein
MNTNNRAAMYIKTRGEDLPKQALGATGGRARKRAGGGEETRGEGEGIAAMLPIRS